MQVYMVGGVERLSPVGIDLSSPGLIVKGEILQTSYPIEPGVACDGIFADGISR